METGGFRRRHIDVIAVNKQPLLDDLLDELTDFARNNDKERCFPKKAWTRESTRNFIHFHLNQGTLLYIRDDAGALVGFTTWWRWNKSDLKDLSDDDVFQNPPTHHTDGDLLYLSDVVTTEPGAMRAMGKELVRRNPDYADLEIWGTRQDKETGAASRVRYTRRILDLIA